MIDASKGFIKDGNKNRLREQDIHRIVDTFARQTDTPHYARMVPFAEIADPKNDFNLNLPRYIDSAEPEDLQDINGHLNGGIPERDIDAFADYWQLLPGVRATLFEPLRPGYARISLLLPEVKPAIFGHPEFTAFNEAATERFNQWRQTTAPQLTSFTREGHPKALIESISETLLNTFKPAPLIDAYDIYQHLMDYWAETMQDDCYLIALDGWVAKPARIIETDKKGRSKDKGWVCDLLPKSLIVARYFAIEQAAIEAKEAQLEAATASLTEQEEEHGGEEGYLGALDKIAKAEVNARIKEIKADREGREEFAVLKSWLVLSESETILKRTVKELEASLDRVAYQHYPKLTETEIKRLVVDDKWMASLSTVVQGELDRVSQTLTGRIRQLAERYDTPLPQLVEEVDALAAKVDGHLKMMGANL